MSYNRNCICSLGGNKNLNILCLVLCGVYVGCTFNEVELDNNETFTDTESTPNPSSDPNQAPNIDPNQTTDPDFVSDSDTQDPPAQEQPQIEGLIGEWTMNENVGLTVNDSTSGLNHGVIRNSIPNPWVGGYKDSAIAFGGNNDVSFPNNPLFKPASLTLSAWIKVDTDFQDWGWLVNEGDNYGMVVNRSSPGDLFFYFYNGTTWPDLFLTANGIMSLPRLTTQLRCLRSISTESCKTTKLIWNLSCTQEPVAYTSAQKQEQGLTMAS